MCLSEKMCYIISMKHYQSNYLINLVTIAILVSYISQVEACSTDDGVMTPSFAEPIRNVTVQFSRDVTLACTVDNLGIHQVAWIHLDRQTLLSMGERLITRLPRYSVQHDNRCTWYLTISRVTSEDTGVYMCQVNTQPMLLQQGHVTVTVPPVIDDAESSGSDLTVREGGSAVLRCSASGKPSPSISWRREDSRPVQPNKPDGIYNGSELRLTALSRTMSGNFLCIANNGVPPSPSKVIRLRVEFSPVVHVNSQTLAARDGATVRIRCRIEAHPQSIHYWSRGGTILLSNKHKYRVTENHHGYFTTLTLTIFRANQGDLGTYRCVSKNYLGSAEQTVRLYGIDKSEEIYRTFTNKMTTSQSAGGLFDPHTDPGAEHGWSIDYHQETEQFTSSQSHLRTDSTLIPVITMTTILLLC